MKKPNEKPIKETLFIKELYSSYLNLGQRVLYNNILERVQMPMQHDI